MNFGSIVNDDIRKQQQPTYLVAPNFTTRPHPNGPLDLGTLVEDLDRYYPINQGAHNRVPIPEGQSYTDIKENVQVSLNMSLGGEGSVLAKVLDRSIGGDVSLKGQRRDEDVYKMEKLETVYFYPPQSYIRKCLQLADVKEFHDITSFKEPVYLITGLKIAWGATISMERGRGYEGNVEGGIQAPGGPADMQLKARVGVSSESGMTSSFGEPADFVLGIQVQKIYHKRAFLVGEPTLTVKRVARNAVLVDDDEPEAEDADDEVEFEVADLGPEDLRGLVPWAGGNSKREDEIWFVPSDVV